jgi:hypothetical protein
MLGNLLYSSKQERESSCFQENAQKKRGIKLWFFIKLGVLASRGEDGSHVRLKKILSEGKDFPFIKFMLSAVNCRRLFSAWGFGPGHF